MFEALADATRRAVLRDVATRGPRTATELAAELPVSRQAVAKHLAVLREAGLVAHERAGGRPGSPPRSPPSPRPRAGSRTREPPGTTAWRGSIAARAGGMGTTVENEGAAARTLKTALAGAPPAPVAIGGNVARR